MLGKWGRLRVACMHGTNDMIGKRADVFAAVGVECFDGEVN